MIPLVYIAGPLGAPTQLAVRRNIEAARDLAMYVAQHGVYPITPHMNTGEFYGLLSEEELWIPGTMELLRRCDAIVCTPNWDKSKGARAEVTWALQHDMPMLTYEDQGDALREIRLHDFCAMLKLRAAASLEYDRIKRSAGAE